MNKRPIFFAHANGFPALTYSKLFSFLSSDFEIAYVERLGHNPKFPVSNNWDRLGDEVIEAIEASNHEKVIGVGHSLGGVLHLIAASRRPELFSSIILLDAMVISPFSSLVLKLLKRANMMRRYSPSRVTRFRRNGWQTENDVLDHFAVKEKFREFDADVLRDYARFGTVTAKNKRLELFFQPSIEAKIYETIPDHLPSLKLDSRIPTAYIGGTDSREGKLARLGYMKRHFPFEFYTVEGSHLFPFENPAATAKNIRVAIKNLEK